jgi:hypothetical protein
VSGTIVKSSSGGHWYQTDGKPCHTVIGKNGNERNTTLRDARTMNLLPSVTTILKTLAAPQLTRWMVENAIIAALTATQGEDEDLQQFAVRVADEAGSVASTAADFGTRFHAMMEEIAKGNTEDLILDKDLIPYFPFAMEWMREHVKEVISTEQCIVGEGYAGTADLLVLNHDDERVLFDFKTKQLKRDAKTGGWKKPVVYDNWEQQLAAYGEVLNADRVANVIVNSREPGPFTTLVHKDEKRTKGWAVFQGVRDLWQTINNYTPAQG